MKYIRNLFVMGLSFLLSIMPAVTPIYAYDTNTQQEVTTDANKNVKQKTEEKKGKTKEKVQTIKQSLLEEIKSETAIKATMPSYESEEVTLKQMEPGRKLSNQQAQKELSKLIKEKRYVFSEITQRVLEIKDISFYAKLSKDDRKFLMQGNKEEKYELVQLFIYQSALYLKDKEMGHETFYQMLYPYMEMMDQCSEGVTEKERKEIDQNTYHALTKFYQTYRFAECLSDSTVANYIKVMSDMLMDKKENRNKNKIRIALELAPIMDSVTSRNQKTKSSDGTLLSDETSNEAIAQSFSDRADNQMLLTDSLARFSSSTKKGNYAYAKSGGYFYVKIYDKETNKRSTARITFKGRNDNDSDDDNDLFKRMQTKDTTWDCSISFPFSESPNQHKVSLKNGDSLVTKRTLTTVPDQNGEYFVFKVPMIFTRHAHYTYYDTAYDKPEVEMRLNTKTYAAKPENYGENTIWEGINHAADGTDNFTVQVNAGMCGLRTYNKVRYNATAIEIRFRRPDRTITYKSQGSTYTTRKVQDGESCPTSVGTPTRTGYTFKEWSNTSGSVCANRTCEAQWTKNSYKVTVNPNGGSYNGTTGTTEYSVPYLDGKWIGSSTRQGYNFSGYTYSSTGIQDFRSLGIGYTTSVGTSTGTFSRTFSNATSTNYKWSNINATSDKWNYIDFTPYTTTANHTYKISGYIKVNSMPSGASLSFYHGAKLNDYANSKLSVSNTNGTWKYFEISRTFTSTDASSTARLDVYTSNLNGKTGNIDFDLKEIKIEDVTSNSRITDTCVYVREYPVTLYAKWIPWQHTVTYNANGGSGAPGNQTKTYGSGMNVSETIPTRNGYHFASWNTKQNNDGTTYLPGNPYTNDQNGGTVTLYAQWDPWTHFVYYDANGGENAPNYQRKIYDRKLTLSDKVPTRTGYNFLSWNTQADGTGTTYNPDQEYTNEQDGGSVNLYAQWEPWTHTISYDANGGTSAPKSQTKKYGADLYITTDEPLKEGSKFSCWNTQKDGNGTNYLPNQVYTHDQDGGEITLYAKWDSAYKVQYEKGSNTNASGAVESQTQGISEKVTLQRNAFKAGYDKFKEWDHNGKKHKESEKTDYLTLSSEARTSRSARVLLVSSRATINVEPQNIFTMNAEWIKAPTMTTKEETYLENQNVGASELVKLVTVRDDVDGSSSTLQKSVKVMKITYEKTASGYQPATQTFLNGMSATDRMDTYFNHLAKDETVTAEITYQATNSQGVSSLKTQTVKITYNEPPTIKTWDQTYFTSDLTNDADAVINELNTWFEAHDTEDKKLNVPVKGKLKTPSTLTKEYFVKTNQKDDGAFELVYSVTDSLGKTATATSHVYFVSDDPYDTAKDITVRFISKKYLYTLDEDSVWRVNAAKHELLTKSLDETTPTYEVDFNRDTDIDTIQVKNK